MATTNANTAKKATKKAATTKAPTSEAAKRSAAAKKAATTRKRKEAAEKAAATRKRNERAAEREKVAPKRPSLTDREPRILAEDASYAAAGLAIDAVSLVRSAIAKLEELRTEVQKAASDPSATVRSVSENGPATVTRTVDDVRGRFIAELETAIANFEDTFDTKATEGRKLVESLKKDGRVARLLDQTSNSRAQVKAALTSVTKTLDVAVDAGRKQAGTATGQVKGATTSVTKTLDVAVAAGRKQAETAASQVKAAVTSLRRTADAVPAAASATEDEVEKAS